MCFVSQSITIFKQQLIMYRQIWKFFLAKLSAVCVGEGLKTSEVVFCINPDTYATLFSIIYIREIFLGNLQ